jgi:hypothetical protein
VGVLLLELQFELARKARNSTWQRILMRPPRELTSIKAAHIGIAAKRYKSSRDLLTPRQTVIPRAKPKAISMRKTK